jgi:subtilase family serine protease
MRLLAVSAAVALGALIGAGPAAASGRADLGKAPAGSAAKRSGPKRLDVVLGLDRRQGALERFALRVSDPDSALYGGYLRPRQVGRRFGASDATARAVLRFLRRRRIRGRLDVTRSFVEALVPVRRANRLFRSRAGRARAPVALRGKVHEVLLARAAADQFLPAAKRAGARASRAPRRTSVPVAPPHVRTGTPSGCARGQNAHFAFSRSAVAGPSFTPNQIQQAYGAEPLHAAGIDGRGVRAGIYGASGSGLRELRAYARCFGLRAPPVRLVKVGHRNAGSTSFETALDLQMLTVMAPGLESLTVYSNGSNLFPVDFSAMLDPRNGPPPDVFSASVGECETAVGRRQLRLTAHVLAAAAAAGVTVAAGSGDNGSFCPDGPNRGWFPGDSAWLTSVGGTSLALDAENRIVDEVPWNNRSLGFDFGGGGGFSRFLPRPPFQRGLGRWGDRRGYPDVALFADPFPGIAEYCRLSNPKSPNCAASGGGNPYITGNGTSAAGPLFAGIAALVDQRLRAAGRPPLGFADPLLYRLGRSGGQGALRDIVNGSNSALWKSCCKAFPGYDRASGWGSVNAAGLAAAALAGGPG